MSWRGIVPDDTGNTMYKGEVGRSGRINIEPCRVLRENRR